MDKYANIPDEDLIELLRSGANEVMDYLLEKYKPMVRRRCNALYLIGGENEDLIQEGMIGLFKAVRDYDRSQGAGFSTFAQLCVNRQLYSALEASNRKKNQPLNSYISMSGYDGDADHALGEFACGEAPVNPEELVLEQEKMEEFQKSLHKKLSTMEKRVLTLYLGGENYLQIAEHMNKPPKSIDNALQRIRTKVREILENPS